MLRTLRHSASRASLALVLSMFAFSGALGLAYQVLWSKYLLDFIGVSAYSYAAVLAAFMGGLALGSALLGRFADRAPRPLLLFAALEAGIGLYAFAYPRLQAAVAAGYGAWAAAGSQEALFSGAAAWPKALAAAALLLPPTLLMGGTYPAVLRHATAKLQLTGRRASQVYAVNALGAAAGSLLAAFVMIPRLGMQQSLWLLGASNLALAALAAALGAAVGRDASPEPEAAREPAAPEAVPQRVARVALGAVLAAGFLSFSLELAWTRYLSLVIGSSTDSFAVMLAAFVAGIGLGSAWLSRHEAGLADPLARFGWTQLGVGVAVLLPLPLYPYLPWLLAKVVHLFAPDAAGYAAYTLAKLVLCMALLLPATMLMGMSLPLLIKGLARSLGGLGRLSGRCYAWNTTGNVAGALVAGQWLLPGLGVERLFRVSALASALLGFGLVFLHLPVEPGQRRRRLAVAATAVLLLMGFDAVAGAWAREWFSLSPFRRQQQVGSLAETRTRLEAIDMLLFEDDPAGHLMVFETTRGDRDERTLLVNAKPDASAWGDMPTQVLAAEIPMLLHPQAKDVLVVGLASGITVAGFLDHPVERVDVVEIVRAMPKATRLFAAWNGDPLADPRARLFVTDARDVISYGRREYDVIVSEPSNPWMAGVGGLFSEGYYRRAAGRLREGGLYAQWLQAYELDDATFGVALSTLRDAFPYVYAFQTLSTDLLLVGSKQPLRPDWEAASQRAELPAVRERLATAGISDLATVLALQRLSPASVDVIAARTSERNTDDNRLLEYRAPLHLFAGSVVTMLERLDERLSASPALLWSEFVHRYPERVAPLRTLTTLTDGRMRLEPVRSAWATALVHLEPERLEDWRAEAVLPLGTLAQPPLPAAALAKRIQALLDQGRTRLVEQLIAIHGPALLTESALSAELAALWLGVSESWDGRSSPELWKFRIELLMAVRDLSAATAELRAWLAAHPQRPGDWEELRACQIERGGLCEELRARRIRPGNFFESE